MNYELAKELKDAGFPQKLVKGDKLPAPEVDADGMVEGVYAPTLSELIAACGAGKEEKFFQLNYWPSSHRWIVEWPTAQGTGPTPEEAVGLLWLSLNKKQ